MQKILFYTRWILGIFILLMWIAIIKDAWIFLMLISLLIIPISYDFLQKQSLYFLKKKIPTYVVAIVSLLLFLMAIILSPENINTGNDVISTKVISTDTGWSSISPVSHKNLTLEEKKNIYKNVLLASKIAWRSADRKFPISIEWNPQKLWRFQATLETQYTKEILEKNKITESEFLTITTLAMNENWWASFQELWNGSIVFQKQDNCLDKSDDIFLQLECFNR